MPDFSTMPEVFVSNAELAPVVSRETKQGRLRKIGSRLYTLNLREPAERIVQRNLWPLVATMASARIDQLRSRTAPLEMTEDEFRSLGHQLVDRIAGVLASMRGRAVTAAEPPVEVRAALNATRALPEDGTPANVLLQCAADLLFDHSLVNGHPRFYGYITSPAAPIGMLAELLAAAVNANVGAWKLSPMATEIEAQTVRWLAQFIGYPTDCGGLLVGGGNMANLTCFLAARAAKAGGDTRTQGVAAGPSLLVYAS